MSSKQAIYLCWDETKSDFRQVYDGGGYHHVEPYNTRTVTIRARYSGTVNKAMLKRAQEYIDENMQDGRENVRIEVLPD